MKILAIETSCDDTSISILEIKNNKMRVLAHEISSQTAIHTQYGGVFPTLAKREHIKNLPILFEKVIKKTSSRLLATLLLNKGEGQKYKVEKPFDLICITSGPGLEPALWTGIVFAKELSQRHKIPIIPVNHMEGHILSVFGNTKKEFQIPKIKFPVLSLLVSGGHTELVLVKDWGKYQIIGETLDDACGEAFDKVARMMDLPYPGGPEISKLAEEARRHIVLKSLGRKRAGLLWRTSAQAAEPSKAIFQQENMRDEKKQTANELIKLPRPMMYSKDFNFSFSGLKTAVLYLIRDLKKENKNILNIHDGEMKKNIALEFENAVVEVLIHKTKKVLEKYKVSTLIVGGGVAQNKYLQKEIKRNFIKDSKIFFPEKNLTSDNSIMIAIAGYLKFMKKGKKGVRISSIKAEGNLKINK
ncbi:MAG: tRNA (adenosine(37)-N6)-threonylcarbamoyltransferase complex transferase subunit TsaD [bacterium]|nr:tRNA (adenosine(37)-N6)-threonylcarbamoyltransferase complex transferase subunit TsaD [bacterium]